MHTSRKKNTRVLTWSTPLSTKVDDDKPLGGHEQIIPLLVTLDGHHQAWSARATLRSTSHCGRILPDLDELREQHLRRNPPIPEACCDSLCVISLCEEGRHMRRAEFLAQFFEQLVRC